MKRRRFITLFSGFIAAPKVSQGTVPKLNRGAINRSWEVGYTVNYKVLISQAEARLSNHMRDLVTHGNAETSIDYEG